MKLLQPLRINDTVLPNRIVVPAMVTRLSGEDGYVNDPIIDRYVRYAEGHVGLIVVEATAVHGNKSGPLLRLSDDSFIAGHRKLVERVRGASDSKIVPQIIHFLKVARSGWRQTIDSLSTVEIDGIIEMFADAARRARAAGYDGVELHSAHAYTLSSFLSRHNPRRDEYDGRTLEGRLRLFGKVLTRVRERVGDDFIVGARFLAEEAIKDGYALPDSQRIALRMAQMGVDYVSLSVGGKFEDAVHRPGQPLYPYTGYSGDRCMPGVIRNTIILAVFAGTLWRSTGLGLAPVVDSTLGLLAQASVPAALVSLGLGLVWFEIKGQVPTLTTILVAKLVVMPIIAAGLAVWVLGLDPVAAGVVVLFAAMPSGANAYLFAARHQRAVNSASGAVALGTALSAITAAIIVTLMPGQR